MKLFGYEIKKLFGMRLPGVLLAILLLASGVLCYITVVTSGSGYFGRDAGKEINRFLALLQEDRAAFDGYLQLFAEKSTEKALSLFQEWEEEKQKSGMGDDFPPLDFEKHPELLYTYHFSEVVPDMTLYAYGMTAVEAESAFQESLQTVLKQAKSNAESLKKEYGYGMDDYLYYYQVYVYRQYEQVQKAATVDGRLCYGWEEYFACSYGDLFLLAFLILFACMLYLPEGRLAVLPVITVSKKGRMHTALAKAGLLTVGSMLAALLFAFLQYMIIAVRVGFSGGDAAIQNIPSMAFFPHPWSISGFFVYTLLLKLLGAAVFALTVALFSLLTGSPLLTGLFGGGLLGASVLLYRLDSAKHPALQCLNLFSLVNGVSLSRRLYVFRLFDRCVEYLGVAWLLVLSALPVLFSLCLFGFVWCRKRVSSHLSRRKRAPGLLLQRLQKVPVQRKSRWQSQRKANRYSFSVFRFELKKQYFSSALLPLLLLAFFAGQVGMQANAANSSTLSRSYRVYRQYLLEYTEGSFREQGDSFKQLLDYCADPVRGLTQLRKDYQNKLLDEKRFIEYKKLLREVQSKSLAAEIGESEALYEHYKALQESGLDPYFTDYAGWASLLSKNTSYPLLFVLLLVMAGSFTMEYHGKSKSDRFVGILHTTKNGRSRTFAAKCGASCLFALTVSILFSGVTVLLRLPQCSSTAWAVPLCSLPQFGAVDSSLTVGQYFVTVCLVRILFAVLLSLFCTAVAALCEGLLAGLLVTAGVTLLPALVSALGLEDAGYLNAAAWLDGNEMLRFSCGKDLFGSDFGAFAVFTVAFAVLTLLLTAFAHRKFVR